MASATPDLRLPFHLASVPNLSCLVTEAHVYEELAQDCTRQRGCRDLNWRLSDRESGTRTLAAIQRPSYRGKKK